MKRRFISFLSAVVVAFMSFAQTSGNVVYSWESPEGTVIETGGTIAYVNGEGNRLNYGQAGYHTICLNGKYKNLADTASANAGHMVITLESALQVGDSIYVTAFRKNGDETKKSSIYFLYENGTEVKDETVYPDVAIEGQSPATHGYLIPAEAAGSKTITLTRNSTSTNLFITKFVIVRQAVEEIKTDYTDAIANADLSISYAEGATSADWDITNTKGISGGMVKAGSNARFDFAQTITLPAGQYKMTVKAAYRYSGAEQAEYEAIVAGTETRLAKLYAETSSYKYEVAVQNRYDGASDTDYAAGNGSVTVNGKYVPNSSAAVLTWFNNGQYVNELVFNVQEEGKVKIGIAKTEGVDSDYTNIGAWTLTRLGDAEADPKEEEPTPEPSVYTMVQNEADLVAGGKYLIMAEVDGGWVALSDLSGKIRVPSDTLTISENYTVETVVATAIAEAPANFAGAAYELTLEGEAGAWKFKDELSGAYLHWASGNNLINDAEGSAWTIGFNQYGHNAVITHAVTTERVLQYNASAPRFCAYTSVQKPVYLFKAGEVTVAPVAPSNLSFNTIAELLAFEVGNVVDLNVNKAKITYLSGNNMSITDGVDTLAVYDYNIPADYAVGGWLSGKITATLGEHEGNKQLTVVDWSEVTFKTPVTVESPWVGATIENGVTYYLYNVKAQAFLKGANNWGTRASFGEDAYPYVAEGADGVYALSSTQSFAGKYLGANLFVDSPKADFVFEEVGEGIYTFNLSGAYYAYTGVNTVETVTEVNDGCYWQLLTADAIKEQMIAASASTPYNVTALILGANFGRNNAQNSAWSGSPKISGVTDNNKSAEMGNWNGEKWNAGLVAVTQTLTGLPNGTYELKAQAFYRGAESYDIQLIANEAGVQIVSINVDADKMGGAAPNSQADVSKFFDAGHYDKNSVYFTVTDGTATIGVQKFTSVTNDWLVFDNFRLTYYGNATVEEIELAKLQAYIDELTALVNEAKAVEATYSDGAKADLDAAVAVGEAALATPTQDGLIAAVAPLEAAIARATRSVAINAVAGTASLTAPVDFTKFVVNPDMETGDISGWTTSAKWQFQNNNSFTNGEAVINNKFQERWEYGTALGNTSTKQVLADMPNGIYRITASIIATAQYKGGEEKSYVTGAYLFANSDSVSIATENNKPELFTVEAIVVNDELTIGIEGVNTTANWLAFDNVTVQYYGAEPEAEWIDITAERMVNGDLSSETGWTGAGVDDHYAEKCKFLAFYAGWGSLETPTAASLKQDVTLPAGEYRLTGKAFFRQGEAYSTNPTKSLGYMVAGENKVLVKTLGSVEGLSAYANSAEEGATAFYTNDLYTNVLEFTLAEETTLSIGYECDFDEMRSWMGLGSMKLEKKYTIKDRFMEVKADLEMLTETCTSMYALGAVNTGYMAVLDQAYAVASDIENASILAMNELIPVMVDKIAEVKAIDEYYLTKFTSVNDLCNEILENSTPNTQEAFNAFDEVCALAGFMNLYSNVATLDQLQTLADTLESARRIYVVNAAPVDGYSFDYTFLVEGVGNSTNGWVKAFDSNFNRNYQYQNSDNKNTETLKKNGYIEAWNNGANFTGTLTYEATLPNGYYTVSAYAFTDGATSFVANTETVVVEKTGMYVQPVIDSVLVKNGKMTFGLNIEGATWVGITNIELAYTGDVPADTRKAAFVERYTAMEVFSQEQLGYAWNGINNTYFWPVMDAARAIKDTIDNVTDMALLDSMMAEMDKAEAAVLEAYVVGDEYNVIKNLFWNAADNSVAATDEVRMAMEMALENSNYAGYNIATIEALETAVADIKAAYLAYVTNAIANEGYKFDATFMLVNPSFETGDLTGWEANKANDTGVKPNTDGTYTMAGCDGDYLFNTWYGTGIYVQQTVKELPAGTYALSVVVASDDILLNITAGNKTIEHLCQGGKGTGSVVVVDSVAHEGGDFLVKVATVNNDWFKADNFQLHCLGVEDKIDVAYLCGATESTEAIYNALVAADYNVTALNYDNVVLNDSIVEADFVGKYDVVVLAGGTGSGTNLAKAFNTLLGKVPVLSTKAFWYAKTTPAGTNGGNPGAADSPSLSLAKTVAEHPIYAGIEGDTFAVFNDMAKSNGRYLQSNGQFANNEPAQTTLGTTNGADCIGEAWVGDMGWLIIPVDGAQPEGYLTEAGKALFVNAVAYLVAGEKYEAPVVEVATVTLDKTEAELTEAGATVQLTATVAPENATDKAIKWTSSDEKVATVDANGLVTAVANGTATITATAANGVKAECVITVKIAVVDGIEAIEAVENAVIYTITGKAVQGDVKTLERGIYIINGKKVLVK